MLHQNINGLINKSDLLHVHLSELYYDDKSVDVICVTEHNMVNDDVGLLNLPNYTLAAYFARKNRNGGSCILVRNIHKYQSIPVADNVSVTNLIECSAVELVDHRIIVICIYRPPKTDKASIDGSSYASSG